jgi:hypothetical protein
VFGYPVSLGIKDVTGYRPLLRKGIVAGKNIQSNAIILDCPAYYGNSGSLVIEKEVISTDTSKFMAIGVVSRFAPFIEEWYNKQHKYSNFEVTNSGYTFAVPMDIVLELLW